MNCIIEWISSSSWCFKKNSVGSSNNEVQFNFIFAQFPPFHFILQDKPTRVTEKSNMLNIYLTHKELSLRWNEKKSSFGVVLLDLQLHFMEIKRQKSLTYFFALGASCHIYYCRFTTTTISNDDELRRGYYLLSPKKRVKKFLMLGISKIANNFLFHWHRHIQMLYSHFHHQIIFWFLFFFLQKWKKFTHGWCKWMWIE